MRKNNFYNLCLCCLILFTGNLHAQNTTTGTNVANAVINFTQLAQYYAAHPDTPHQRLLPEPEDDINHPINSAVNPADIHYRTTPIGVQSSSRLALLPASPAPSDSFESTLSNGQDIPPDTHGAVDSAYLVTAINSAVHIQNRTGGNISSVSLDAFWNSVLPGTSSDFTFDPRIHYDPYTKRWIMVALCNGQVSTASLLVAMSQTNDPTGNWNLFRVLIDATGQNWLDFPNVGFNQKWIVVSGNMFANSGASSGGARVYCFNKANIMSNTNANHTIINQTADFSICPALIYDSTQLNMWAIESANGAQGQLRLFKITGAVGSEVMTSVGYPATTNYWQRSSYAVTGTAGADFAPQLGTTNKIQTNDDRMNNLVYRNGKLWCSHIIFLPYSTSTNPTRASAQWWQLDTLANPLQIGRIDDATNANFYAFPSIAVNKYDDALIGFSHMSSTIHPSAVYALHMHTDPIDSMRPYNTFRPGQNTYYQTFSGSDNRWGDYSATMHDPINDIDFWTIQEASASTVNIWDTWWAHIRIVTCTPPSAPTSVNISRTPCIGDTATYTVSPVTSATSYTWTVNGSGWSGTSTTNTIVLTAGSSAATISVTANDSCGPSSAYTFSAPVGNCCIGSALPVKEGFEGTTYPPAGWSIVNQSQDTTWTRVTWASGFGQSTACSYFGNYNDTALGKRYYLYTKTYSFASGISSTSKLKFDYAYSPFAGSNDSLQVFYSTNCGSTWTSLWVKGGTTLGTTGTTTSTTFFVPTATQWVRDSSVSLASLAGQATVQFAFVDINHYGNNLFLDNINIDTTTTCSIPATVASVTKPATHCSGTAATYTAATVTGATSYTWTVAGTGWSGSSTTNTISLTAGTGVGTITVKANNTCGSGTVYTFLDTPATVPAAVASVTRPATHCSGTAATYTAATVTGATSYTWTVAGTGWSGSSTTNTISLTAGTGVGTITVKANNTCGSGTVYTFLDTPATVPAAVASVTRPATHCSGTAATYTAATVTGATSYTWTVAGTGWSGSSTTNTISLTAGTGVGTITVKANNTCGSGTVYTFLDTPATVPAAVASVTRPATHCSGTAATYTAATVTGATSYTWTVAGTGWSGSSTTNTISLTAGTGVGTITVKANNTCGSGTVYTFLDTPKTVPAAPASVTLPAIAPCTGATAVYSVPLVTGATSYTWSLGSTGWSGSSNTNSITLTAGSSSDSVSVTANNTCGSSLPYVFLAPHGAVPAAPTSVTLPATPPCTGATASYSVPTVTGASSYTWSISGAGWSGSSTTNTITLTAGTGNATVSVTANNSCGSSTAYVFTATHGAGPAAPSSVTLPTAPCTGATAVYTVPTVSGATSYTWSESTGWSGTSTTNSVTLTAGSSDGTITVTANDACGSSTPYVFTAPHAAGPSAPSNATLPTAPCPNATAVYSVPTVTGATSYTWSVSGTGWSGSSTINTITLTAGTVNGSVSVTANNACGPSTVYTFTAPIATLPATPSSVTLPTAPCPNSTAVYTVPTVSGATSYTWSVSGSGWSGSSSTNTITLTAGAAAATVSVTANNNCGSSSAYTFTAPVSALPSVPGPVTLPTAPCPGATAVYTVPTVSGASSYSWSVNGTGWTGSSTTNSITLTVGTGTASVSVSTVNNCGTSSPYVFSASSSGAPPAPATGITAPSLICTGQPATFSTTAIGGATSYNWTYTGTGWTGSSTTNSITLTGGTGNIAISVNGVNSCGSGQAYSLSNINVVSTPVASFSESSHTTSIGNTVSIVFTGSAPSGTSYSWTFDGGTANPGTGVGPQTVNWPSIGTKLVTLTLDNGGCVSSVYSDSVVVSKSNGINVVNGAIDAVNVIPNPASGQANIIIDANTDAAISVDIYDMTGRMIGNIYTGLIDAGKKAVTFNTETIAAGIYSIRVSDGRSIMQTRFIKL